MSSIITLLQYSSDSAADAMLSQPVIPHMTLHWVKHS